MLLLRKTHERERLRRANELLQRDVERAVGDRQFRRDGQTAVLQIEQQCVATTAFPGWRQLKVPVLVGGFAGEAR